MNVVVALEYRFDRTPDGAVWTQTQFAYPFWTRYLDVFVGVRIMARVREVPEIPIDFQRVDGDSVSFVGLPYYVGPRQYLQRLPQLRCEVTASIDPHEAVILRVPSPIAGLASPLLQRSRHPYGVEVVGDPYDTFSPGAVQHPLRAGFRWRFRRQLRQQCADATAAAYVTEQALQRRYPCPRYMTSYSSIQLLPSALAALPREPPVPRGPITLVTVGTLAQLYKAPDVLIDAIAVCVRGGLDVRLVLAGDGQYRAELEALVATRGLSDRVTFLGQVPAGEPVQAVLDSGDLFVLPSRQEGLPRAMIEAMARALPCIGSNVGGIPELLPPEDLVPANDASALAAKISEVASDPGRMARMSARNLAKAAEYREDVLRERRIAFYREVHSATEAWIAARRAMRRGGERLA